MSRAGEHSAPGPARPEGRIKGVAFLGVVKLLRSRRDEAQALLRPELQHFLSSPVSPSAWYSESDHAELLRVGAQLYPGSPDRALELMGEAAARDHAELYRELLVGPGSRSRAFAVWSSQHDTGELHRVRETANRMRLELVGFADATREHCLLLTGYFRATFTLNGCSDVAVEKLGCRVWGDGSCVWRCTWKRSPE